MLVLQVRKDIIDLNAASLANSNIEDQRHMLRQFVIKNTPLLRNQFEARVPIDLSFLHHDFDFTTTRMDSKTKRTTTRHVGNLNTILIGSYSSGKFDAFLLKGGPDPKNLEKFRVKFPSVELREAIIIDTEPEYRKLLYLGLGAGEQITRTGGKSSFQPEYFFDLGFIGQVNRHIAFVAELKSVAKTLPVPSNGSDKDYLFRLRFGFDMLLGKTKLRGMVDYAENDPMVLKRWEQGMDYREAGASRIGIDLSASIPVKTRGPIGSIVAGVKYGRDANVENQPGGSIYVMLIPKGKSGRNLADIRGKPGSGCPSIAKIRARLSLMQWGN